MSVPGGSARRRAAVALSIPLAIQIYTAVSATAMDKGLSGPAIAEAIRRARVEALAAASSIPSPPDPTP